MMTKFIGEETRYILVRRHGETNREEVAIYNEYNSTFNFVNEIERSSLFKDFEKVAGLKVLQQALADLMGSGHDFKVIKQEISRSLVEEDTE